MKPSASSSHQFYLDFLRVLSCVLIVLVHTAANGWDSVSPLSFNWQVMNAYDCIGILGVPMFVMLSGSLLLDEKYALPNKKLLIKALHLFILYFFWTMFYHTVHYIQAGTPFSLEGIKQDIILKTMLPDGIYHLWFLPMLICLYIATPILREIAKSQAISKYFLITYFFVKIMLPTIFKYEFPFKYTLQIIFDDIPFVITTGYTGYYLLGHYLRVHMKPIQKGTRNMLGILGLLSISLTIVLCAIDSMKTNTRSTIMNDPYAATNFIACICLFLFTKETLLKHTVKSNLPSILSSLTLGIYLLHPLSIDILNMLGFTTLSFTPLLAIPVFCLTAVVLSVLLAFVISKLPFVGKYLIS